MKHPAPMKRSVAHGSSALPAAEMLPRAWFPGSIAGTLARSSVALACLGLFACSSAPTVNDPIPGTTASHSGTGAQPTGSPSTEDSTVIPVGSSSTASPPPPDDGGGQPGPSTCDDLDCGPGQHCEDADAGAACVDYECADLECEDDEKCVPHDLGGSVCVRNSCESSVDCKPEEYCNPDKLCQADVCEAEAPSCDGDSVLICDSSGGREVEAFTCGSDAYFTSECSSSSADATGCTCADDWDCPNFTACEVGLCKGTGRAPSCQLPPLPFGETPPAVELHWGGDSIDNDSAHDGSPEKNPSPWPRSSHSTATPAVANLDDDNGDGLINELDFPEIIFVTYPDSNIGAIGSQDGVLRAIHGGGPNKGKDLFAVCDTTTWNAANPTTTPDTCTGTRLVPNRNAVAVADLDRDGVPEIVYTTLDHSLAIVSNQGALLYMSEPGFVDVPITTTYTHGNMPSVADLDFAGLPEVIVGREVFVLGTGDYATTLPDGGVSATQTGLHVTHHFTGQESTRGMHRGNGGGGNGSYLGPTSCVADLHPEHGQEVLVGSTLYRMPELTECDAPPCEGDLITVWNGADVNTDWPVYDPPLSANDLIWDDGYCAVADIWGEDLAAAPGPDNPPDGIAEAILIADGHLVVLEGATGTEITHRYLEGGALGGAPNVDDFDGDGFAEISSALSDFFVVVDLQEPTTECPAWDDLLPRDPTGANTNTARMAGGACSEDADCGAGTTCNEQQGVCVCLHNGWRRGSDDNSSKVTSSSVFDFNGDGKAEVIYNDECELRVYDGANGDVLYNEISRSRTAMENPVVADVDNDGNAEIVAVINTEETGRCNDDPAAPLGPNGIRVFGDPLDSWVSARRIWNQFAYHVTNITEGGSVPVQEPESWRPYNGRLYNTYRSQPRSIGAAPDLQVTGVSLFSPNVQCGELGDQLEITFEITNAGDLRVGPGVLVSFYGTWGGDESELLGPNGPLTFTLTNSLEPGRSVIASVTFDLAEQGQDELPDTVRVAVDTGGDPDSDFGAERECHEDNNDRVAEVAPGQPRPDLSIDIVDATPDCPARKVELEIKVTNAGTADAEDVKIEIFAGDPSSGGTSMLTYTVPDPIPAGESVTVTITVPNFPLNRTIELWGKVDPNNEIAECNEGDNLDSADAIRCTAGIQT